MHSILQHDKETISNLLADVHKTAQRYFENQQTLPPGRFIENIELKNYQKVELVPVQP